jgi:hypothetical protein
MTTFDYAKMATLAETLLTKFGQSLTLTSISKDWDYDPHTGDADTSETTSTVVGVILPTSSAKVRSLGGVGDFDESTVDQDLVDSKRRFGIVKAKDATKPNIADLITTADGSQWRVTGVTPVSPAGTDLIYRLGLEAA